MRLLGLLSLAAATLLPIALAGKPKVFETTFGHMPSSLFYFEDSSVILALEPDGKNVYRSDNDGKDWDVVDEFKGKALDMYEHPFDKEKAVVFGDGKEHWKTSDKGKSWKKFKTELPLSVMQQPLSFNANKPDYVLFAGRECESDTFFPLGCVDKTYYTTDWFDSDLKLLAKNTHSCLFARGNKNFKEASDSTVLCVVDGKDSYPEHRKLLVYEDYGEGEEPKLDGYNTVKGLAGVASVSKFLVAAVRSEGTEEMALFVSANAKNWDRAEFPQDQGGLKEGAYTILESTPYSIQVDVLSSGSSGPAMGELFTSNSNGTYFTRNLDNTNRHPQGLVDFEQIEGIDGIVMANVVKNADDVRKKNKDKKLESKISFDDGKEGTWKPLMTNKKKKLHLHSVTALINGGRVFSSRAPGIVMGVGNTGDHLDDYTDGDLYISDDAGLTWTKTLDDAHKYEFGGSGSIIVAIEDEGATDKVLYSKDHGKHWDDVDLDVKVKPRLLTTTPDSTSLKFLLIGTGKDKKAHIFGLDFSDVFDRQCEKKDDESKSDFEKWYARYDDDGKPDCLMGRKQFFWRRKADADCNAAELYKEPIVENEDCKCQKQDFECDFNFIRDSDRKCVPAPGVKLPVPPGECKKPTDKYQGSSGYRKIPGNSCKGGEKMDDTVERDCTEAISNPSTGKIISVEKEFKAKRPVEYFYLDSADSSTNKDETIIMMTEKKELYLSDDGGREWKRILENVKVLSIYPNPHLYDHVYFITTSKEIHYTHNRGKSFHKMDAPALPNRKGISFLEFHPHHSDWLIFHGEKDCTNPLNCYTSAWYTTKGGDEWHSLKPYTGLCKFIRAPQRQTPEKLVFCEHEPKERDNSDGVLELISSSNWFEDEKKLIDRIVGFATMQEFIVVAGLKDDNSLKALVSVDGNTFADANFPHGFNVPRQNGYTVLDSVTHAIFLHVTVSDLKGAEYGTLLKSNSNGTNYVLSLDAVNRNAEGYVDFEKMESIEGIAIVNRVINAADVSKKGDKKKLRSLITHNDGGEWKYIAPPASDSEGKSYKCSGSLDKCSLNFHHYTERTDTRHTFSSGSAIGLMMGVGNVGDSLKSFTEGDTFLTTDGGLNWKEVKKGQYLWEYGDQGSIIVIVDRSAPTNKVFYTLDEGASWQEYQFGETMRVTDITTIPADNSRKFLLWGYKDKEDTKFHTVHLDFQGITDQLCVLHEEKGGDSESDDFYLWSPGGIDADDHCLFGHEAQYHRKIPERRCYIGRKLDRFHKTLKNCTCGPQDFECDFNYQRASDNTCKLVAGLEKPDHSAVCKDKNTVEYYLPTGYRRIPMSTCEGGKELDKGEPIPCPGKEDQFKERHGKLSGFGLFLAIVFPISAAGGIGYLIWKRMQNGGFGAIRLGEDHEAAWVRYPIIVIAAVVTVVTTVVPAVFGWVKARFGNSRRYTTRSSFARGRGDYSAVSNDEGELLGVSDDEDDF